MNRKNAFIYVRTGLASAVIVMLLPFFILSCGGGGGGDGNYAGGGVSGTGVSSGAITAFGSVILNNSEYEVTSATSINVNDSGGMSQSDLKIGMVAVVEYNGANATSITVDNELKGPVDSVDAVNNSLTVIGTEVIVDNSTVFDNISPANLTGLTAGDYVEVHGLFDFLNNNIRATFIGKISQPGAGEYEVKGKIANFDSPPGTFTIGGLTVNYQSSNVQLPAGTGNGSFVEAKGNLTGGILVAAEIEAEAEIPDFDANDEFEIEGIVTSIDNPQSPDQITINGQTIQVGTAEFDNGDAGALIVGIRAEVEGKVNAGGAFIASKIEIEDSVKTETTVDMVDSANQTLTVFGSLIVRGTSFTDFEDDLNNVQNFGIADINSGDFLEIQGFPDGSNNMVAIEVKRKSNSGSAILQGPVQSISNPNLTILGVSVITNGATQFKISDAASDSGSFFGSVKTGDIVKAKEDPAAAPSGTITAKEIAIEGQDD